ncbi:SusC/RagA family TonB-linked outer membrane protein [uncultured Chitinophaga sp.]|uniref:SusC/RagA family TonB-linked outer membrane protein n=1 Tax=uncultured Chitinophaga sp. TaxID=339340 RepID=UPI0025E24CCB|nr:SusC/RagA family TonB-linked outer membrane protein [uncultured Chitinophaga sp.]
MQQFLRVICISVGLVTILPLAGNKFAHAIAMSQDTKNVNLTIQVKNKNMEEVFADISAKTGMSFHYDKSELDLKKKVTLNCNKVPIDEVLQQLSEQTGFKFTRKSNKIIVGAEVSSPLANVALLNAAAIEKEVRGTVRDAKGGGLPGVTVMVKNTNRGTQTNANGVYVLGAEVGEVLLFRSVGFLNKEVVVGSSDVIDVVLEENVKSLSEFVVTALGVQKKSKELTYATQQLNSDDLTKVRDANVINSLAGKAAGVTITRSASGIGGSSRVVLRGNKSTRENQPMYVIDGVPMANFTPAQPTDVWGQASGLTSTSGRDGGDGISNINPDDIESINILKGASAAALYGSQASNGVIIITTKKGRAGKGRIDFFSDLTLEKPSVLPKLQYSYGQTEPQTATNTGSEGSWGAKVNAPDHVKDFFKTGTTWTNGISFSGGNEIAQTYFSYSNTTNKGIIPTSKFDRHTLNFRETLKLLNDKLSLDANITFLTQNSHNRPTSGLYYNPLTGLYVMPRGLDFDSYRDNFEYHSPLRNLSLQNWWNINEDKGWSGKDEQQNPYWTLYRDIRTDKRDRALSSLAVKYQLLDWLTVQGRGSFDKSFDEYQLKAYAGTQSVLAPARGRYTLEREYNTQLYADVLFTANKKFDLFSVGGSLGSSITDVKAHDRILTDVNPYSTNGLNFPNQFSVANILSSSLDVVQGIERKQTQAVFGSAQLGYKDYLFVDLTGRNDWSSTLAFTPTANKGYFYYSAGITAVLSEMVKMPAFVSFAKVRASFAKVGNDIFPYATNPSAFNYRISQGSKREEVNPRGPYPSTYLEPEDNRSFEVGADLQLFDKRVMLDVTYYNNNNFRQYMEVPAPSGSAYTIFYLNLGQIRNTGVEAMLTLIPVRNKLITWTSNINFAQNKNEIVSLTNKDIPGADENNFFKITEFGVNMFGSFLKEGGAWGDFYTNKEVVRNEQGQLLVEDDGTYIKNNSAFRKLGNPNPTFTLGWNNTIDISDFSLSFLIDGRFGGKVMSITQATLDLYGVSAASADARDAGGITLPGNVVKKSDGKPFTGKVDAEKYYNAIAGRAGVGEFYVYDATSIRLRELALSYKLPIRSKVIRNASIGFIGRNLFFLKRDAPFDPETSMGTGNALQGIDVFGMPATRSFGASLKVGF